MFRIIAVCSTLLAATAAQADTLRIIVPFSPGGAQDTLARWYGTQLGQNTDFQVIVENRPGASGSIAANEVAQSATDGNTYTVLAASGGAITVGPNMHDLTYDVFEDFKSIASTFDTPMTLAVRADSPYESVEDVIAAAKEEPGDIAFASTGFGSVSHLTGELFQQSLDIDLLHIPYKGAAPGLTDLLGGDVPLMITSAASVEQYVESGDARVLAAFSPVELSNLEGVPTIEEVTGIEGLNSPVWGGYLAPAGMDDEVIATLTDAILEICDDTETRELYGRLGATAICGDAEALDEIIAEDFARWEKVIKEGGITPE